jgi:hypothetical protein
MSAVSDIELTLDGSSTGAVAAFDSTGEASTRLDENTRKLRESTRELSAQWDQAEKRSQNLKAGFLALGASAVKFGADAVEAYAEAERVSRQLERAARDLSGAFEQQADAIESKLRVDGELIKQQQTLLLQWGAAPEAIGSAIVAIQDYAAAQNKDALSATTEIIKAVETGGQKLKSLGYEFETTGDKARDFAAITQALSDKVGGAAEVNAQSLSGRLGFLNTAFENLKEAFGGVIASMEGKLGIIDKTGDALQRVARNINKSGGFLETFGSMTPGGVLAAVLGIGDTPPAMPDIVGGGPSMGGAMGIPSLRSVLGNKAVDAPGPSGPAATASVGKHIQEETHEIVDAMATQSAAIDAMDRERLSAERRMLQESLKQRRDSHDAEEKMALESYQSERKAQDEHLRAMLKAEERAANASAKTQADAVKKKEQQWKQAGDQIGAAFINALADQLAKLAEGGEFDVALFVGEILAATVGTAATIIGTAYGAPAVGAAVGNLAAMGIRAGAAGISKANRQNRQTYHDGGSIESWPRYHSGGLMPGEVPIIAQEGEYMWSRADVARAGGSSNVAAMAKGGGRVNVYVSAIDSRSVAESAERDLGKGVRRALRSGRGDLPAIFGVPR